MQLNVLQCTGHPRNTEGSSPPTSSTTAWKGCPDLQSVHQPAYNELPGRHPVVSGIPNKAREIPEQMVMSGIFFFRFMWHERMTDSEAPQRPPLCFLSTLLSQKVPEKSDAVLRCIISGNHH